MITFDNPIFEELFNGLFTGEKERELKIIIYENSSCLPMMYSNDDKYIPKYEETIQKMERDIAKAKKAMALFTIMREAKVNYTPEEE